MPNNLKEEKRKKVLELYPIDYPFETIVDRISKGKLTLNPDFQRRYKWDKEGNEERTSKFIESCLMRIPLPACYLAETPNGKQDVIDGVQRMTTIKRFLSNEFKLEGLTVFPELNGRYFRELGNYQEELESTTIRCIVLRKENARELVNEIFARLNKGAVELTPQEIRNAIYPGRLNDLLAKLAAIEEIQKFKLSKTDKRVTLFDDLEDTNTADASDRVGDELVLRFFALQGDLSDYKNKLHPYLDAYMKTNQHADEEQCGQCERLFRDTLAKCKFVFEEDLFGARLKDDRESRQGVIYYDMQMWSMQFYNWDFLNAHKKTIKAAYDALCRQEKFGSGSIQQKSQINHRRSLWRAELEKIKNAVGL